MSSTQEEKDQFDVAFAAWKLTDDSRRDNLLRARNGNKFDLAQLEHEQTRAERLMRVLMEKAAPFLHPRK